MLRLVCECGKQYRAQDQDAGRRARCKCGRLLQIPGPTPPYTRSLAALNTEAFSWESIQTPRIKTAPPPRSLGYFVLQRKLGEGAMGEVWLARDTRLDRDVAVKALPAELRRDTERLKRFVEREAKLSAQLHHPHVVSVFQLGDDDDQLYLVMEYVDGGSLADQLQASGPLPWRETTRVIRDAAAGLEAAHRLGLVHRDIKPANLLLTRGGVTKVADFGIARTLYQPTNLTQQGNMLGTPSYMSPEQWEGKEADPRSDLYALICTFFTLLTGKPPFEAENCLALGYQHRYEPFPDPRRQVPSIPESVWEILERGARKAPAERYQTATELVNALERVLARDSSGLLPESAEHSPGAFEPLHSSERQPSEPQPSVERWLMSKVGRRILLAGMLTAGLSLALTCLWSAWSWVRQGPVPVENTKEPVGDAKITSEKQERELWPRELTNSIGMKLMLLPSGGFVMGSPDSESNRYVDEHQHRVWLTRSFYLGVYEVTQDQYERIMGTNPSRFQESESGENSPVEKVSWFDATEFCRKLSELPEEKAAGRVYRLPTEAEWEYACRAGTTTRHYFGDDITKLGEFSWFDENSGGRTQPVGQKTPNAWGLFDMHGNVSEWCQDWYLDLYSFNSPPDDPPGPEQGSARVVRGGSWLDSASVGRSGDRHLSGPTSQHSNLGFRVALDRPPQ